MTDPTRGVRGSALAMRVHSVMRPRVARCCSRCHAQCCWDSGGQRRAFLGASAQTAREALPPRIEEPALSEEGCVPGRHHLRWAFATCPELHPVHSPTAIEPAAPAVSNQPLPERLPARIQGARTHRVLCESVAAPSCAWSGRSGGSCPGQHGSRQLWNPREQAQYHCS